MKVLFCHDGPLSKDDESNYYGSAHTDSTFNRYYSIADKLAVLIRVKSVEKNEANQKLSKITVAPFEVIECPNISSIKGIFTSSILFRKTVEKEVKDADYIVARLPSRIGFTAIDYAKKYNKPYLIELVTCPWDAYWNHSTAGKLLAPLMYRKTKKRVKEGPYVIYVTNSFLQKRYPTFGQHTNCSNVALKDFEESILADRIYKISNKVANKKIVLGTVGALNVKFKGQQYIIRALGQLKKEGIVDYEYHLVGSGSTEYLRSIAKKHNVIDQIKFIGPLPHHEVFEWMKSIDIYTQPSRQEGLPRALIEAMSLGLPAFGAKTAGIPELLEEQFIFNNNKENIKEIIAILEKFDEKTFQNQAKRNFKEAKEYKKEIIESRRIKFFQNFIKN